MKIIVNDELEMKKAVMAYSRVLLQYLQGQTEENHEISIPGLKISPGNFQI
jgi:hypothetical protein